MKSLNLKYCSAATFNKFLYSCTTKLLYLCHSVGNKNGTHNQKNYPVLDSTESTVMPPSGLQIYLRPCMTLTFDLLTLTPKIERFIRVPHGPLVAICIKNGLSIYKVTSSQVW